MNYSKAASDPYANENCQSVLDHELQTKKVLLLNWKSYKVFIEKIKPIIITVMDAIFHLLPIRKGVWALRISLEIQIQVRNLVLAFQYLIPYYNILIAILNQLV